MPETIQTTKNILTDTYRVINAYKRAGIMPEKSTCMKIWIAHTDDGLQITHIGWEGSMLSRREIIGIGDAS